MSSEVTVKINDEELNVEGISEEDLAGQILEDDLYLQPTSKVLLSRPRKSNNALWRSRKDCQIEVQDELVIPNPPQIEEDVQEPVFPPQDNQDEDKGRDWLNEKPPEVTPPSQQLRQQVWDRYGSFMIEQQNERKRKFGMFKPWQYRQNDDNLNRCLEWPTDTNKEYRLYANKMAPRFNNKAEEKRFFTKRRAAKYFCKRDYIVGKTYEQTKKAIGPNANNALNQYQHKTVAVAFISDSFRRYQSFIMDQFDKKLRPLSGPQLRIILYTLLNSELYFTYEQFVTFRRFVKIAYDLGSVSIYEQPAKSLYKRIQYCLRERANDLKSERSAFTEYPMRHIYQQQKSCISTDEMVTLEDNDQPLEAADLLRKRWYDSRSEKYKGVL